VVESWPGEKPFSLKQAIEYVALRLEVAPTFDKADAERLFAYRSMSRQELLAALREA
jgi:hypothetical protein